MADMENHDISHQHITEIVAACEDEEGGIDLDRFKVLYHESIQVHEASEATDSDESHDDEHGVWGEGERPDLDPALWGGVAGAGDAGGEEEHQHLNADQLADEIKHAMDTYGFEMEEILGIVESCEHPEDGSIDYTRFNALLAELAEKKGHDLSEDTPEHRGASLDLDGDGVVSDVEDRIHEDMVKLGLTDDDMDDLIMKRMDELGDVDLDAVLVELDSMVKQKGL